MKTKKTGSNRETKSSSMLLRRQEDVAWVLENKKGIPNSSPRERLLRDADRIFLCERRKTKAELKASSSKSWFHPTCRHPLCPRCQGRRFDRQTRELLGQFTGYDLHRLYIFTLALGPQNVRGQDLGKAMKKMKNAFDLLCRLLPWKKDVKRCAGPQHRTWIPASDSHVAGFWVHNQGILLARSERPRWKTIAECYRQILGLPKGTPRKSYFFTEPLDTLEGHSRYLTKTEQLIPGVDFKEPREQWKMRNIPDEDLVAFIDAVKYRQRVYHRGGDPSRKPPKQAKRNRE